MAYTNACVHVRSCMCGLWSNREQAQTLISKNECAYVWNSIDVFKIALACGHGMPPHLLCGLIYNILIDANQCSSCIHSLKSEFVPYA